MYLRTLGLIVFLTLSSQALAQCDSSGHKAVCALRGPEGQLLELRKFRNGRRHGYTRYYDSSGMIWRADRFRKGERRMIYLFEDGEVRTRINRKGKIRKSSNCNCGK